MILQEHLFKNLLRLAPKGKKVVLAVSGGSDSVALLRLFESNHLYQEKHDRLESIVVAHFDHALRENSAEDAKFVHELCQKLNVSFYTERQMVARIAQENKWNLEDVARRLRYTFLSKIAKQIKADAILTAHTLDDQAETVLMQLLRGTAFITGMPNKQGQILRPLLDISRSDLQSYLKEIKQNYTTDESNQDTSKTRAWLRHEILPKLEQRYPSIKHTLSQLATIQQDQKTHFDTTAKKFIKTTPNVSEADISPLLKQDIAMQRHIIASLANNLEYAHIETIRENLNSKIPIRLSLPDKTLARIAYGKLSILAPSQYQKSNSLKQKIAFENLDEQWKTRIEQTVDFRKLEGFKNLVLRHRQAGDTIHLSGGSKKISDLLIDLKIPKEDRDQIPMLVSGKEVLWIQDIETDTRVSKKLENLDITYMKRALLLAKQAIAQGDLPVGCVIVKDGQVIAEAFNQTEANKSPFAHAEILAIQQAAKHLGDWRLEGCTLYVTLEPCPMCFGAILQAHISKVVYGAANPRDGALGSVMAMQDEKWKRKVEVISNILEKECSRILSEFFKHQRNAA